MATNVEVNNVSFEQDGATSHTHRVSHCCTKHFTEALFRWMLIWNSCYLDFSSRLSRIRQEWSVTFKKNFTLTIAIVSQESLVKQRRASESCYILNINVRDGFLMCKKAISLVVLIWSRFKVQTLMGKPLIPRNLCEKTYQFSWYKETLHGSMKMSDWCPYCNDD